MDFSDHGPAEAPSSAVESEEDSYFRRKPDGTLDPAGEAGWFLQRERERLGLSLDAASEATGIHPYHLEAFELGDLTRMPNRADALNMIGYYAHYLGFDPEPLIHHYGTILPKSGAMAANRHPANPGPLSSALILKFGKWPKLPKFDFDMDSFPGGAGGAAACFLAAVLVFAGASFLMLGGGGDSAPPQKAEVVLQPPAPAPVTIEQAMPEANPEATPQLPPVSAMREPTSLSELDSLTALIEQNVPEVKPAADGPDATASIAPGSKPAEAAPAAKPAEETSRLTLKAKGPVWVRIEDQAGNVVMTQMLMAGDTYQVPNREGLVVIARDGGLLAYLIDGKEKGILGPPGEILVGRPLDLKTLESNG
jgi:cytoskeleton protein RodZ